MASTHKHIRSSTANKRPTTAIADGQIALNTNSSSPGLFFKDSTGATIIKVGPVHVGATAPNATPPSGGSSGNSTGEIWLDTSLTPNGVKIWDGSAWVNATPIGSTTVQGLLELATNAETQTGSDTARAVTPAGLQSKLSDSTSTTSSTTIASSTAVKSAYDLANAALPKSGGTITGNLEIGTTGSLSFEGATADAFETTIAVTDPTADRTITLPDQTGSFLVSGNASIVNADVNASAAIAGTKISPDFGSQNTTTTGTSTAASFIPTSSTAPTNGVYLPSANNVAISTNSTGRLFVDSSGRVLTGVSSTSADTLSLVQGRSGSATGDGVLFLARGSAPGTNTNPLGTIQFSDNGHVSAARIQAIRDGASYTSGSDQPSAITFATTASSSATLTERARIESSGRLLVGLTESSNNALFQVKGGVGTSAGNLSLFSTLATPGSATTVASLNFGADVNSSNTVSASIRGVRDSGTWTAGSSQPTALAFLTTADGSATNTERARIDSSGRVGIGTTTPGTLLEVSSTTGTSVRSSYTNSTGGRTAGFEIYGDVSGAFATRSTWTYAGNTGLTSFTSQSDFALSTAGSERVRIDSSGNSTFYGLIYTNPSSTTGGVYGPDESTYIANNTEFQLIRSRNGAGIWGLKGASNNIGSLIFKTHTTQNTPAERLRITSDAYVRLASGTGGIQFNGDTAATNALDDYEGGTFTPTIVGLTTAGTGTYTTQTGHYTKIGRTVTFTIQLAWSAHTGSGNAQVQGLPFTSLSTSTSEHVASVRPSNFALTASNVMAVFVATNATVVSINQLPVGGGAAASVTLDTSASLFITGTYQTA